jgi:hypothetical protein
MLTRRIVAALAVWLGCACAKAERVGCYTLEWRDSTGRREPLYPTSIQLSGGPHSGSVSPGSRADDTTTFWSWHPTRFWTAVDPDSVEVWFGASGAGRRLRLAVTPEGLTGWAIGVGGDAVSDDPPPPHVVRGIRIACSIAPAT